MRIMAEKNSNMEKDILNATLLVDQIRVAFSDLTKVLIFKKKSENKVAELENEKKVAIEKLASIQNSLNVQRLNKHEIKDKLHQLPRLDIKSRLKLAKELKTIAECRHDLKELRTKTNCEIAELDRLIQRRKAIRVHENLFSYITNLLTNLNTAVSQYRTYRKDFHDTHGLWLPSINLSDLIERTNGKEIRTTNFELPELIFVPFIDEEQYLESYTNELGQEFELYDM